MLQYASCVRNKDIEARKKAAIGLGQLAGLYSKAASQRLQDALIQIGQQMAEEKNAELQTLLSAAFVRLSQESAARRYYRAMQQALDSNRGARRIPVRAGCRAFVRDLESKAASENLSKKR